MQTLYKYNPDINQVQTFKLVCQDEKFITIEDEHGTKGTELLGDLGSYSETQAEAVERYIDRYSDRMKSLKKRIAELTNQHVAAVDLYEELTEQ